MSIIKVIYDDGNNGLVKAAREKRKTCKQCQKRKKPYEMTTEEIMATGCGIFIK